MTRRFWTDAERDEVRRLAHSLDKPNGNMLLARQAVDYLRRHGLEGSPLRDQGPNAEITGLSG